MSDVALPFISSSTALPEVSLQRFSFALVALALTVAPQLGAQSTGCAADNAGLTLPAGFCATVFADKIGAARHLVVAPNGDVFVNMRGGAIPGAPTPAAGQGGGIVLLRDTNRDGKADEILKVADAAGTGIALANGHLYATHRTAVVRYPYTVGAKSLGVADTVVKAMPGGGHAAYNFVVQGRDLFLNVGSRTNSCQERDRQQASAGIDPCVELETRAGIWKFDATRSGQTAADGVRIATGIRNAVALGLAPDGGLWAAQHGRDMFAQNWGRTEKYSADNPGEEIIQILPGDDFGWPYCYWSVDEKKKVLAPEYGGDGTTVGRCESKKGPVYAFPGHWAPNAIHLYRGNRFPAKYRSGVFVAFHGSWNRAPLPQAGFNVAFLPLKAGRADGEPTIFADGFYPEALKGVARPAPSAPGALEAHRPTGLAEGPDGSLYVSDDAGGRIYRISYRGR